MALEGTHLGACRGLPATAHDPTTLRGRLATVVNHPVAIGRAVLGSLVRR